MNTKHQAHMLRQTRQPETPFHVYPSSGTVRSLATAMIEDLHRILESVPEGIDVPPWNVMLMSQAADNVNSVKRYVAYYSQPSKK